MGTGRDNLCDGLVVNFVAIMGLLEIQGLICMMLVLIMEIAESLICNQKAHIPSDARSRFIE